jgi:hypothetical protein
LQPSSVPATWAFENPNDPALAKLLQNGTTTVYRPPAYFGEILYGFNDTDESAPYFNQAMIYVGIPEPGNPTSKVWVSTLLNF